MTVTRAVSTEATALIVPMVFGGVSWILLVGTKITAPDLAFGTRSGMIILRFTASRLPSGWVTYTCLLSLSWVYPPAASTYQSSDLPSVYGTAPGEFTIPSTMTIGLYSGILMESPA